MTKFVLDPKNKEITFNDGRTPIYCPEYKQRHALLVSYLTRVAIGELSVCDAYFLLNIDFDIKRSLSWKLKLKRWWRNVSLCN